MILSWFFFSTSNFLIFTLFLWILQAVTDAALLKLKSCFMEAYDDNQDGKIDIREVCTVVHMFFCIYIWCKLLYVFFLFPFYFIFQKKSTQPEIRNVLLYFFCAHSFYFWWVIETQNLSIKLLKFYFFFGIRLGFRCFFWACKSIFNILLENKTFIHTLSTFFCFS